MAADPGIYTTGLDRTAANHHPLSPVDYLRRAEAVHPDRVAVVHGELRLTYRTFGQRARRLASALHRRGIGAGAVVAVMAPNVPALLEAHYGVPGCGAVLVALNVRLDAASIRFILDHSGARIVLVDRIFSPVMRAALDGLSTRPAVVDIDDAAHGAGEVPGPRIGTIDYEALLDSGDPAFEWICPADEWQPIAVNYTSGTTGNPKGVVYSHRGAYLNALSNVMAYRVKRHCVYLWTLPMFHCNGWCFTWAITAVAGTHVCLRRPEPAQVFAACADADVDLMCGAPIILTLLIHAPDRERRAFGRRIRVVTGGAAPPSAVIAAMEALGFDVQHAYGLTETYGPAVTCYEQAGWRDLPPDQRALQIARQGVGNPCVLDLMVADPETLAEQPWDGRSPGEIMLRGNTTMRGYLRNDAATAEAFRGGWFHSGDIAVRHPDGYVEVKDRAKDVIISGGENISSLEVEEALYRHPAVMEAAVVARPDPTWGEAPCAFVTLKPGTDATEDDIIGFCKEMIARFKAPRTVVFGPLPKTPTGKIQKFVLRDRARSLAPGAGP